MELRVELLEGRATVPTIGDVCPSGRLVPPFEVRDGFGRDIEPVAAYLRDLAVSDCSPLTLRSYAFGLLRWFRLLWLLEVGWEMATEADVVTLVGWLRSARNPQRRRSTMSGPNAGSVNARTGKPMLAAGYAPSTINHALSVVSGFYQFHAHVGQGPVVNPVPVPAQRRRALSHRSPLEPEARHRRARLRQRMPAPLPRAIPDRQWDELFDGLGCDRDRALLEFYVSSGARATELLGVGLDDVDWVASGSG